MTRTRTKRTEKGPIDLDPLTAIRRELVAAASRKLVAKRRRRRALAAGAASVGALALSAAAVAVTESGTGVGAIDDFLNTASQKPATESHPPSDRHGADAGPELAPPPEPDFRAVADSASDPFRVQLADDRQATAVGYTSQDGAICAAGTDPSPRPEALNGFGGCAGAAFLQTMLERHPVVTVSEGQPNTSVRVVQGYATGDVRSIGVLNAPSDVHVSLSDSWTPKGWRGQPLRVFFVTQPASDRGRPLELTELELEAHMADGRTIDVPAG